MAAKRVPAKWRRFKACERAVEQGYHFDAAQGRRIIDFAETFLVAPAGMHVGEPLKLLPHQADTLMMLYGWRNPDGGRRFNRFFYSCAKQNGKSLLAMIIALYETLCSSSGRPIVWIGATDGKEGEYFYENLTYQLAHSQKLREVLDPVPSKQVIYYPSKKGRLQVLTSKPKRGVGVTAVLLDEFAFHANDDLYTAVRYAGAAQLDPLLCMMSTSGRDRGSTFYNEWRYGEKIITGEIDSDVNYLPVIYTYRDDSGDDVFSEEAWRAANPSYDYVQNKQEAKQSIESARHSRVAEIDLRNLRLNQWCSDSNVFLNLDRFEACACTMPDLTGCQAWIGIDPASLRDMIGLAVWIPKDGLYYLLYHAWTNRDACERRIKQNLLRYETFAAEGHLTISEGQANDFPAVRAYVHELNRKYKVKGIVYDASHAGDFGVQLLQDKLPVTQALTFPKYTTNPMKKLDELVTEGKLRHDGGKLLNWQAGNLLGKVDAKQYILPAKATDSAKIDIFQAAIYSLMPAVEAGITAVKRETYYDTHRLLFV